MTRQPRAELTRATIIEAAAYLFDRQGYGAASLNDIAGQGRVTKGALYFHFASKEELALAVIERQDELTRKASEKLLAMDLPGFETVVRMTFELAGRVLWDPVTRAGMRLTLERAVPGGAARESYGEWVEVVAGQLERAVAELDVRPTIDPRACAGFIISAVTGIQLMSRAALLDRSFPQRVAEMWDVIIPGLLPPRRSPHYLELVRALTAETELVRRPGPSAY
ncbi:ScbR family autoregulator-binding transcription factor [Streptomyces sp. FH025]|uniref:ScbR family autoregulator-binding transcription factor n=1 Tax=Streptomyces sp. FH025 TaxID=2815937 RepID=UPI001A9CBD42|nr:ScbR family autoregulator-binding transcription factor [Streptomyces sp. FH025]MBO1419760.1 TetR/AcrR family transcriptional regulator [Streptomyces sp. FH025]